MEIIFREMPHTYDEVVMGHKLWFPESIESDVISATANIDGFTPLTAISRKYGWRNDLLTAASMCNDVCDTVMVGNAAMRECRHV